MFAFNCRHLNRFFPTLSDTAVTATLIPVLGSLSRKSQIPLSRLLIPLSYGSLVGGINGVVGGITGFGSALSGTGGPLVLIPILVWMKLPLLS